MIDLVSPKNAVFSISSGGVTIFVFCEVLTVGDDPRPSSAFRKWYGH